MMKTAALIFAVCCAASTLVAVASVETQTVTIEGMLTSQKIALRPFQLAVHVNGGEFSAFVRSDNTFAIPDVPVGAAYLVEVISNSLFFEKIRLSVSKAGNVKATKADPADPRSANVALPYPLRLEPRGRLQTFEIREGFNFAMIYQNPMMLMMGFSMLMMFMMKYMVDPEQMKEMQEQMADQGIESNTDMFKAMMKDPSAIADKKKGKKSE